MSPDAVYTCAGINGVIFRDDVWDRFHSEYVDEDDLVSFLPVHHCDPACRGVFLVGSHSFTDDPSGIVPDRRLSDWGGWLAGAIISGWTIRKLRLGGYKMF